MIEWINPFLHPRVSLQVLPYHGVSTKQGESSARSARMASLSETRTLAGLP